MDKNHTTFDNFQLLEEHLVPSSSNLLFYENAFSKIQLIQEITSKQDLPVLYIDLDLLFSGYVKSELVTIPNLTLFTTLESKINEFGLPVLLKTRTGAYDGRGNFKISTLDQIPEALQIFKGQSLMIEKFVDFKMEVSVIASRSTSGEIRTYPLVENMHKDNILNMTIAPARTDETISKNAEKIAHKTMEVLHGAGVFGIEMFVTDDNHVLINEIAPRVHNSGHHTLQSSITSQFEQHLRAILGLELGDTKLIYPTIMYNILGPKNFTGRYKPPSIDLENTFLKLSLIHI